MFVGFVTNIRYVLSQFLYNRAWSGASERHGGQPAEHGERHGVRGGAAEQPTGSDKPQGGVGHYQGQDG